MRYFLPAALLPAALLFMLFGDPASAQSRDQRWALCESGDPVRSADACTALIDSGAETPSNLAIAYSNRGISYSNKGEFTRAVADYERALAINPNLAPAMNSLAWDLATMPAADRRDGPRAVDLAERALVLNQQETGFLDTLGAAYAEAGRFADAVRTQQRALELLRQANGIPNDVIADFESRLRLYQNKQPFHRPQ